METLCLATVCLAQWDYAGEEDAKHPGSLYNRRQKISAAGATDLNAHVLLQSLTSISWPSVEALPTFLLIGTYADNSETRVHILNLCAFTENSG